MTRKQQIDQLWSELTAACEIAYSKRTAIDAAPGERIMGYDVRQEKLTDGSTVLNVYLSSYARAVRP